MIFLVMDILVLICRVIFHDFR